MTNLQRWPHPHLDPVHPKADSVVRTNPPVFVWKPESECGLMSLIVSTDADLRAPILDISGLEDSMYLPVEGLPPGKIYWQWSSASETSPVYSFEISKEAVTLEIPLIDEWLNRYPANHPRIFTRPEFVPTLQSQGDKWTALLSIADTLLNEPHEMEEPPFLSDRREDYVSWFNVWYKIMWGSRKFVHGAYTLALAYLVTGNKAYGRAACKRLSSVGLWDPEGSSYLGHNDEAHMSVIWHGPAACDWVWDLFTEDEKDRVISQYMKRGMITFDHMCNRGCYGITRFDSHAGREIVFLALIGLVFHEHIPQSKTWLSWLRPILCGVWPIWGDDDGGWAEGISYSTAYVEIMTMFATALKVGTAIDLYRRPFWKNHAIWRQYCWPPYAEWIGFGDHSERWKSAWEKNANLVELIALETESTEFNAYIAAFKKEAELSYTPPERDMPGVSAQLLLNPDYAEPQKSDLRGTTEAVKSLKCFPDVGWTSIRTDLVRPEKDIAFIFRSSPYGAVSHSHANNNDFIIHVGGKIMAMPSGYYAGYGSDHHAHWVWHTKSHNCLTLSGAPQLMRSHHSRGYIDHDFENEHIIYFRGTADESYSDRALRCRRHVCFLKQQTSFLIVDEFVARNEVASAVQWNIHARSEFTVDETARSFTIDRDGRSLRGHILYSHNGYFSLSEGWDPPPNKAKSNDQWHNQYHLRYTPSSLDKMVNLGVLLCPALEKEDHKKVLRDRRSEAEYAALDDVEIYIRQEEKLVVEGKSIDGLIYIKCDSGTYYVNDAGLHTDDIQDSCV